MVFSSMTFVPLFLPLVLVLYYATRHPGIRNGVLLAFSLLFYAWGEPKWIFVMLLTVTVNYLCGLAISRSQSKAAGWYMWKEIPILPVPSSVCGAITRPIWSLVLRFGRNSSSAANTASLSARKRPGDCWTAAWNSMPS